MEEKGDLKYLYFRRRDINSLLYNLFRDYYNHLIEREWESHILSCAEQAQSTERRWQRFIGNHRIKVRSLYIPLVIAAISNWQGQRLYFILDNISFWIIR